MSSLKGCTTSSYKSKVLLVEGEIDKDYFEFFRKHSTVIEGLCKDVEVVPYGGKDTLKNTLLVKFVLSSFDRVFITYDLDAHDDVKHALNRVGLKEVHDFLSLGCADAGKDCIEGLLPERVLAAVNGRETNLVMRSGSTDPKQRRDAKQKLKKLYLEEFEKHDDYSKKELDEFGKVIKAINARFVKRR